jgi:hypothetical protein
VIGRVSTVDGSTAVRVCARGTCGPKFMDRSMDQFETWRRQQDPRRPAALHAAFTDAYTTLTAATPRPPPRRAPLRLGLWHTHGCGYDGILLNLSDLSDAGAAAIHCLPLDLGEAPQNSPKSAYRGADRANRTGSWATRATCWQDPAPHILTCNQLSPLHAQCARCSLYDARRPSNLSEAVGLTPQLLPGLAVCRFESMLAAAIIVPVAEKEVVSTLRSSTWSKLWSTYSMLTSVWALVRSVRRISLLPVSGGRLVHQ